MLELPTFPISTMAVRPLPDSVIDQIGHDVRSAYVERFWLGILGPSATWLLRRLVDGLDAAPEGYDLDLAITATELGLGASSGRHSPFVRTIARCARFGVVAWAVAQRRITTAIARDDFPPRPPDQRVRRPSSAW